MNRELHIVWSACKKASGMQRRMKTRLRRNQSNSEAAVAIKRTGDAKPHSTDNGAFLKTNFRFLRSRSLQTTMEQKVFVPKTLRSETTRSARPKKPTNSSTPPSRSNCYLDRSSSELDCSNSSEASSAFSHASHNSKGNSIRTTRAERNQKQGVGEPRLK